MNHPDTRLFSLMLIRAAGLPLRAMDLSAWSPQIMATRLESLEATGEKQIKALRDLFQAALTALPESPLRTDIYNTRRTWHRQTVSRQWTTVAWNSDLESACADLCRALQVWNQWVKALQTQRTLAGQAWEVQLEAECRHLQQLAGLPVLQKGLLYASHDLLRRLPAFQEKESGGWVKKDRQIARSLWQYATRAIFKTSPLSHFTSVSMLETAPSLPKEFDELPPGFASDRAVVTPNVCLLPALYALLLEDASFYRALFVTLNPCVTGLMQAQYEWLYFDGELEGIQRTVATPALDFVVETLLATDRRIEYITICEQLQEATEAPLKSVEKYLLELLATGLLLWEWPESGLSPAWCGKLYQFLGFIPQASPLVTETAQLLQWLRTAARSLPFQPVEAAMGTQQEALLQIRTLFERYGAEAPPIPPEQVFFEDVLADVAVPWPPAVLDGFATQLAACRRARVGRPLPADHPVRSELLFDELEAAGASGVPFMELASKMQASHLSADAASRLHPPEPGRLGVLLQPYCENGRWKAVVNALFPGGGKLMARWMHLFPTSMQQQLAGWFDPQAAPFPWQDWHNASFQPAVSARRLVVPGGRTAGGKDAVLLGRLRVGRNAQGCLHLFDTADGVPFYLSDLGLEAPDTRPPHMRLLWHLGVPWVSKSALSTAPPTTTGPGWVYWARDEFDDLVLARARWQLAPDFLPAPDLAISPAARFWALRRRLADIGLPRLFFAKAMSAPGERPDKPQYFDADSPFAMQEFEKWAARQAGPMLLTEMLPLPEHCGVQKHGEAVVAEVVLELG